jgi:murein DD-endopeptidase MepM/ murein hydrolase activator NlpD
VALVLENDGEGRGWAIQASEDAGTRIIRLEKAQIAGGIRRFCPNPLVPYADGAWREFGRRVPKLGRLGVRLRNPAGEERRHSGIDVQVDHGTPIYAPIDGTITVDRKDASIVIRDGRLEMISALLPIRVSPTLSDGDTVSRGDLLGTSSRMPPGFPCDPTVFAGGRPHVHWELWTTLPLGYHPSATVEAPTGFSDPGFQAYSPLYAMKLGKIGSPLSGYENRI